MLDYRKWVERAATFTEKLRMLQGRSHISVRVAPPASQGEVEKLAERLRLGIPSPISDFLRQGSGACSCEFWWEPPNNMSYLLEKLFESPSNPFFWGGAQLCKMEDFEYDQTGCFDLGDDYEIGTRDRDCWLYSVPFISVPNGDYVGLYMGGDRLSQEYPVIYLDHDGCSTGTVLSPSFDQFLINWEKLYYIAVDMMAYYILDPTGSIVTSKRELLRQLLFDTQNPA